MKKTEKTDIETKEETKDTSDATDVLEENTVVDLTKKLKPEGEPEKKLSRKEKKEKKQKKKDAIYDVTLENDISYRGPLSYRALKIIGWFSLVFSQYVAIMNVKNLFDESGGTAGFGDIPNMLITSLGLPMILISTFSVLLTRRDNFKSLLIINGGVTAGITILFLFFYYRYALGLGAVFYGDRISAASKFDQTVSAAPDFVGYISFNIFLDIFLCTLFMFFLDYTPQKYFQGKKIRIFRALAALPVMYEILCIVLKLLATDKKIVIPMVLYPMLTTKPPLSFIMFIFIIVHTKNMEKRFLNYGKTHEQYTEYVKTNTNSLQFSKYLAKLVAIFAVIDFILIFVFMIAYFIRSGVDLQSEEALEATSIGAINWVSSWGVGEVSTMILSIPILFLFSYTRTHRKRFWDILIPVFGVIAIILVYIEGIYRILQTVFAAGMGAILEME